jgi:hypothetical protein
MMMIYQKRGDVYEIMRVKVWVGYGIPSIIGLFLKTSFAIMPRRKTLFSSKAYSG